MSIVFGPVPSRRFGISLGIDLSPNLKQCNFDCLYCELKAAKTVDSFQKIIPLEDILKEVRIALQSNQNIDVLTVTANGEPTLYPYLKELVTELNLIKGSAKTLILSNGSTIYKPSIQAALLDFDIVKLSLDCVSSDCFHKLDRADKTIEVTKIIDGMINFRSKFLNQFVIEVLFVKTLNDNNDEIDCIYKSLLKIKPDRIDIGTIDRPPAYNVKPVTFEKLQDIANHFNGLNVNIAFKNRPKFSKSFTEDEIINLLSRRPLTDEDIENSFNSSSKSTLYGLIQLNKIYIQTVSGVNFYKIS